MAGITNITNIWNNVKEVDLRPLREEALRIVQIVIIGSPGSGRHTLADQMRRDPSNPEMETQTPLLILDLNAAQQVTEVDLIILMLDAKNGDFARQKAIVGSWVNEGKKVLVFVNQGHSPGKLQTPGPWVDWGQNRVVYGAANESTFLVNEFVPAVMELLPDHFLSLGRYFPLFRVPVAHHLINETSFSNAAYSLSTGLAEIVPIFDIPLNVADMVVLSKAQAFLVYKLGLALGLSTRWQDYVTEFGSVLGGGFLWRQLARSLVGLIPAWGIVPKVSVAYAGTYVVGNVVLQWYLTGRHVSAKQMRELYVQAFALGKNVARTLLEKVPRPRLGPRKNASLPAPKGRQVCANCGRKNAKDALYCQYCGQPLGYVQTGKTG